MMRIVLVAAAAAVVLAIGACPKKDVAVVDAGQAAAANGAPIEKSDIKGVYDANAAADPRAQALCDALYTLPAERKATCCKDAPGPSPLAKTCAGILTSAMKTKDVVLDEAKAKACIDGRALELQGCAWIGAISPPPSKDCNEVLTGSLDDGARCRSSLECKKGLRCVGASALDTGRCGKPSVVGERCGGGIDALSVVVAQAAIDENHPECDGLCTLGQCLAAHKTGEPCRADRECGAKNRCDAGKCVDGRIALGQACTRGGCLDGARCIDGTCQALRKEGEACSVEFDCARGGCVKDKGAAKGICGMRCTSWQDIANLGR